MTELAQGRTYDRYRCSSCDDVLTWFGPRDVDAEWLGHCPTCGEGPLVIMDPEPPAGCGNPEHGGERFELLRKDDRTYQCPRDGFFTLWAHGRWTTWAL